jgi:hypothetical protein
MLPFSVDQFFGVFASYNRAIWPAQIVAFMIGGLSFAQHYFGSFVGLKSLSGFPNRFFDDS